MRQRFLWWPLHPVGYVLSNSLPIAYGLVPFLIAWGETPHPSGDGPSEVVLRSLELFHPDPAAVEGALLALGQKETIPVREASEPRLLALLDTPRGTVELGAESRWEGRR